MILHDIAYFGIYGNTAVCPICKSPIPDGEACLAVPTLEGMTVHCTECGSLLKELEMDIYES